MDLPDLNGKTALVTGGGRGIGRATALAVAGCGAHVVVVARTLEEIAAVEHEIEAAGGEASAIVCDVSDSVDVQKLFQAVPPIDVLVNSAGIIQPIAPAATVSPPDWLHDIAVNLGGIFLTCRYALPGMLQRGWGRIVNVSSGAARGTTVGWSAYSAAKAGVETFTRVVALEVADRGVRVNAIRPGVVDTEMQVEIRSSREEDFGTENLARFRSYKERGILRDPEEPARLILWLLTPDADEVNGEVLAIDDPEVATRIGLEPGGR